MAYRTDYVDLELRGISEIINSKVSRRAFNYVKNLKNLSAVELGAFETKKQNNSRVLFNNEDEGIRQVLNIKVGDKEERTGILTDKSLYINDLRPGNVPLLSSPQSIYNVDYELSIIKDFPAGIVSCAAGPISPNKTHVLVQTYDKKIYLLQIGFEDGEHDAFSYPKVLSQSYIMDTATFTPVKYVDETFVFSNGSAFIALSPETGLHLTIFNLHFQVKSFIFSGIEEGEEIYLVKGEDDERIKVFYNPETDTIRTEEMQGEVVFPFERNDLNGYTLMSQYFNNGTVFSDISFIPGSGYFYFFKKLADSNEKIELNNCLQAKFLSERALPKAPPMPPAVYAGATGLNSLRNGYIGNGFFQIFPIILPSKIINSDGSIPQPDQLHFIKIYETGNKIRSLRFGNQNLITGSLLRQFSPKYGLVEFGFNAPPELEEIEREPVTNDLMNMEEATSDIISIDDENAYQTVRKRTIVKSGTNLDIDFVQLDENIERIFPLSPLSFLSESALISKVFKAVFSWSDENGIVHRSQPSLSKTYQGDNKINRFIYLDQTFKIFYRRNEDNSYSVDESQTKELVSQRWDYYHKQPRETVQLVSPLALTKKNNVNVELYSTNPEDGSSLNFFLVKSLSNDDLEPFVFPEIDYSVRCEDIVDSRELGTYNTERLTPEDSTVFGRLLLDADSTYQPDGCYNVAEHDNRLYLGLPYELMISEPGTDSKDLPSLIFRDLRVPVSERILGISSQDNNLVLFSREKVHIYNEDFESPRSLRGPNFNLQEDNRHFIEMTEGIIFKDRFKGLFLFTRGNEFQYIGQDVDKRKEVQILDVLFHPTRKEILFLGHNLLMFYNWFFGVWTFGEDIDAVSGCVTNNELYFNEKLGNLIIEEPDQYKRLGEIETLSP